MHIRAYVDGSYNQKSEQVGSGVVIVREDGQNRKYSFCFNEQWKEYHNVAGELLAAVKAVEIAIAEKADSVCLCHDYAGVEKWITREWKAKNELTQSYRSKMDKLGEEINITFEKVIGHSGNILHDKADKLAKRGSGLL